MKYCIKLFPLCPFQTKKKVILDVDVGTDDAWAIKLLVESKLDENIEILGIICSHGNGRQNYVVRNTFIVLNLIYKLEVSN